MDLALVLSLGYPDHMVFSEFRRRFDVLAPHLTKKHGRNYIVVDEKRVGLSPQDLHSPPHSLRVLCLSFLDIAGCILLKVTELQPTMARKETQHCGSVGTAQSMGCRDWRGATVIKGQRFGCLCFRKPDSGTE